ncbi:hypothetical protein [Novosphingobium lentum]|uniref:hypothetical protein n=1 Tax=Novosphingobium lentum TaxID=145287 RepID=UPI000A76EFDC|nr:hypothetical protein [Novosphingobium lentum]
MLPLAAAAFLSGCATVPRAGATAATPLASAETPAAPDTTTADGFARLGETTHAGPLSVRPDHLVEDSRCPMNARCVWAGRLIVEATVIDHGKASLQQLTLGEPLTLGGGQLVFDSAEPGKLAGRADAPGDYRFHFDFRP